MILPLGRASIQPQVKLRSSAERASAETCPISPRPGSNSASENSPGDPAYRFPRGILRRVAIIKVAQRAGVSLKEIGEALAHLPQDRAPTAEDWANLSAGWRNALDERMRKLTAIRDQLNECIGCGCLSLSQCPLRNPEDRLAQEGAGARLIEAP